MVTQNQQRINLRLPPIPSGGNYTDKNGVNRNSSGQPINSGGGGVTGGTIGAPGGAPANPKPSGGGGSSSSPTPTAPTSNTNVPSLPANAIGSKPSGGFIYKTPVNEQALTANYNTNVNAINQRYNNDILQATNATQRNEVAQTRFQAIAHEKLNLETERVNQGYIKSSNIYGYNISKGNGGETVVLSPNQPAQRVASINIESNALPSTTTQTKGLNSVSTLNSNDNSISNRIYPNRSNDIFNTPSINYSNNLYKKVNKNGQEVTTIPLFDRTAAQESAFGQTIVQTGNKIYDSGASQFQGILDLIKLKLQNDINTNVIPYTGNKGASIYNATGLGEPTLTPQAQSLLINSALVGSEFTPFAPLTNAFFIAQGAKASYEFIEQPSPDTASTALLADLAALGGALKFKEDYFLAPYQKANTKFVNILPDANVIARQRGTLLIDVINNQGQSKGIALGLNKQGEFISIGGAINKGETFKAATLREAFEETGLKQNDIINFQKLARQGTNEEIQNIFKATISEETFAKLKPRSDITQIKLFNPKEFRNVFGSTPKAPRTITQGNFIQLLFGEGNKVRITEAAILGRLDILERANKLDINIPKSFVERFVNKGYSQQEITTEFILRQEGRRPTNTYLTTKEGYKIDVGMQSRYDVPIQKQLEAFNQKYNKLIYKYSKLEFGNERVELNRLNTKFIDELKVSKIIDEKQYQRAQLLVSGTNKPLILNAKGQLEIIPSLSKRGGAGFYLQLPIKAGGRGYLGASYVLGGGTELSLSLLPKSSTKRVLYGKFNLDKSTYNIGRNLLNEGKSIKEVQRILNKQQPTNTIGATAKSIKEIEAEVATSKYAFELKTTGQTKLEGQNILLQRISKIKNPQKAIEVNNLYANLKRSSGFEKSLIAKQIQKKTGINPLEEFNPSKQYVSIAELSAPFINPRGSSYQEKVLTYKKINVNPSERPSMNNKYGSPNIPYKNKPTPYNETPNYNQPKKTTYYIVPPYKEEQTYTKPVVTYSYKSPPYSQHKNPPYNPIKKSAYGGNKNKSNPLTIGYRPYYIKSGKRVYLSGVYEKGTAIRRAESYTLSNLRATFGVAKTNIKVTSKPTTFQPSKTLFRDYRVKSGKKIPLINEYIQRRGKRLSYRPEINELQLARMK